MHEQLCIIWKREPNLISNRIKNFRDHKLTLGLARSSSSRVSGGYRSFLAGRSFRRLRGIRGRLLTLARGAGRRNWVAGVRGRDGITAGSLRAVAGSSLGGNWDGISRGFR